MARREGINSIDERHGFAHRTEKQITWQGRGGESARDRIAGQKRAHFGGEKELVRCRGVVEGLDSQAVAREENAPRASGSAFGYFKNCKCKHTPQMPHAILAPGFVGVNNDFRVGLRAENVTGGLERVSQFAKIINLAIEDDGECGVFVPDGLLAPRKVDDAEALHTEGGAGSDEGAVAIRAAMLHRTHHALER